MFSASRTWLYSNATPKLTFFQFFFMAVLGENFSFGKEPQIGLQQAELKKVSTMFKLWQWKPEFCYQQLPLLLVTGWHPKKWCWQTEWTLHQVLSLNICYFNEALRNYEEEITLLNTVRLPLTGFLRKVDGVQIGIFLLPRCDAMMHNRQNSSCCCHGIILINNQNRTVFSGSSARCWSHECLGSTP